MAIRAGSVLTLAGDFLVSRVQQDGVSNLNINSERIAELGNQETVAIVRDVPDLSYDIESLDMTVDFEAILCGVNPSAVAAGNLFRFTNAKPLDIVSPYKPTYGQYTSVRGVIVPYLQLEQVAYRFGVRQNSQQTFTMRGDSVYYTQGSPYFKKFIGNGTTNPYLFTTTPALKTVEQGADIYAYCVSVLYADGTTLRLFHGSDYTDNSSGFSLVDGSKAPVGSELHVVYAAAAGRAFPQSVHPTVSSKPAAVRGRDVDVYVSNGAATPVYSLWHGAQSADITWRVNLEADEELGNPHYISRDYDIPDLSGTVVLRSVNPDELFDRIAQISGVTAGDGGETINALSQTPLGLKIDVSHPSTGALLKRFHVSDARFSPPAIVPRTGSKTDVTFSWASDTGVLEIEAG